MAAGLRVRAIPSNTRIENRLKPSIYEAREQ
jgi:hypothetical protein